MLLKKSAYTRLLFFYASYLWFGSFSKSILPTYFLQQNLSLEQIILGITAVIGGQLLVLLTVRSLSSRVSWKLALVSTITYILLIINIISPLQFYIASAISGFALFFFFMFYNIIHFEKGKQVNIGRNSAIMFSVMPLIGMTAPLLAGVLAEVNINLVWIGSGIFFLLALSQVDKQPNFRVQYKVRSVLKEIKAIRSLLFIEGVWEALVIGVIPVYTLHFIKTPLHFGTFLSYLALVGIIANMSLGKLTDKLQKRVVFLYPLSLILAITTGLMFWGANNLVLWLVLVGIVQFLLPLFWNITTAMVVDTYKNLRKAIPGREITLAAGRLLGLLLAYGSFSIQQPNYIFWVLAGVMLLYALNLYWKTRITQKYSFM